MRATRPTRRAIGMSHGVGRVMARPIERGTMATNDSSDSDRIA